MKNSEPGTGIPGQRRLRLGNNLDGGRKVDANLGASYGGTSDPVCRGANVNTSVVATQTVEWDDKT